MKTTFSKSSKRRWTNNEKRNLMIAYQMGASLKTISEILGRSPTAINKALSRQGIRPLGSQPRGARPKSLMNLATFKTVKEKINEVQLLRDENASDHLKTMPAFDPKVIHAYEALKERKEDQTIEMSPWVTLDCVLSYLTKQGHRIVLRKMPFGSRYWVGKKGPLTPPELLVIANKNRCINHEPPFLLEKVTEA
tara:strand:+ start:3067 stop:3648 length:582 start_codon:yes stop_codon:yes gene_type:complete